MTSTSQPAETAPQTADPTGTPASATPGLDLDLSAVQDVATILADWLEAWRLSRGQSGVQAAIWFDGELVTEVAVGDADLARGIPLETTHRLRIASHSKMFTALAIMRLVEQGKLRLDDTVGERVPALADAKVADRTVRDLLSHSAGISRDSKDASWWALRAPFADRERLLEIVREDEVVAADAGVHLQYSNIGYGILGLIIEEATGKSFDDAVTELVIDPVGVADIGPDLPSDATGPEDPHGFALGHTSAVFGERRPVEQIPTNALAAATGFWARAGAIASFAGKVFTQDALLEPGSMRELRRRVWTVSDTDGYGLGVDVGSIHGFTVIGHSGGFPTGLTRTWAVPDQRLAVSVLGTSNDAPTSELAAGLLGLLALAAGRPPADAGRFEGPGALGGAGNGRPRPKELSEQDGVTVEDTDLTARDVADIIEGAYDCLWGRSRIVRIGQRLFEVAAAGPNPTAGAVELAVVGTRPDPIEDGVTCVELAAWGDSGFGTWAEPMLARIVPSEPTEAARELRCAGIFSTGQLSVPSAEFEVPERVTAP